MYLEYFLEEILIYHSHVEQILCCAISNIEISVVTLPMNPVLCNLDDRNICGGGIYGPLKAHRYLKGT